MQEKGITMMQFGEELAAAKELVVLVVDDNVDAATSLCCLLELLGCKTAVAYDGPSAVEAAAAAQPHAAFIDLDLPGFDGCEVLRRLHSGAGTAPRVSVCVTGHGGPRDRLRCLDAGFDQFWQKPLDPADLLRALEMSREALARQPEGRAAAAPALGRAD
ncbi:response regulator [Eleftheria terrae]|uniref:response regulator n=1 Tax=Eleftheria terrae TaxID=1597781 RepID=UPI00263B97FF|nr:response regulator [Eleftheria terrae]WKB55558.1 response regulator [Eleftheria terrae]